MEYPFWIPDFNRASNYEKHYPLTAEIFKQPNSLWMTGASKYYKKVDRGIERAMNRAHPQLPVFVLYAIPKRDLGHHSAGGLSATDYLNFCRRIANVIGDRSPILIFEPDALPHIHHMECDDAIERIQLMNEALGILRGCKAKIYLDIGHSSWLTPINAADLLAMVHVSKVNGFAMNVSNYRTTVECLEWGDQVAKICGKGCTYVVDTSRNGVGPLGDIWCNPPERALGETPTTNTGSKHCDAYLWVKVPGESDGKCNGGPRAGKFWPEMAETLVKNSAHIA